MNPSSRACSLVTSSAPARTDNAPRNQPNEGEPILNHCPTPPPPPPMMVCCEGRRCVAVYFSSSRPFEFELLWCLLAARLDGFSAALAAGELRYLRAGLSGIVKRAVLFWCWWWPATQNNKTPSSVLGSISEIAWTLGGTAVLQGQL